MKHIKFFALIVLLLGCNKSSEQVSVAEKHRLLQRVQDYYNLEKNGDWASAYEFRSSDFREIVGKSEYVKLMSSLNEGWQLLSYELKGGSGSEAAYTFSATFLERVSLSYAAHRGLSEGDSVYFTEDITWQREGTHWYCSSCGIRYRLELNRRLKSK